MTPFDEIYKQLINQILTAGFREVNARTGHETVAIPGVHFSVDLEKDGFPLLSLRKIPIRLFVAEQIWYIMGSRKPADFLKDFTEIWDDFTNPGGVVTVAYGYRWRSHFGRDQLGLLLDLLQKDPSSRHGVIVTWDPGSDGLGGIAKKNVPCPYTFAVNIIGKRLHLHNIVRSNDMLLGFPHDVAGFALLQSILAQKLGVAAGIYSHSISNAHIYDIHYEQAKELIARNSSQEKIVLNLPPDSFKRAEKGDKNLVLEISDNLSAQYAPLPALKGLKIVL